jgi:tRNA (uracil-5-)-methyltransferase TRM9
MIYVWALEQKSSRRGWDESSEQDVMVPWTTREGSKEVTYQRYYHLFRKGELEECVLNAGGEILERGYERVHPYLKRYINMYRTIGGLLRHGS